MVGRRTCLIGLLAILPFYGCGGGSSSTPSAQSIGVSVSPAAVTLSPNSTEQFTATVTGTTNTAVTWEVNGAEGGDSTVGKISTAGLYTAPAVIPSPPLVSVAAVSQADPSKSGTAAVTIGAPAGAANQAAQSFPIKLGTSGGNINDTSTVSGKTFCCSGTLGSLVSRSGTFFILSNNHILAKSNQGKIDDIIAQPGLVDTNCDPGQPVAKLSQFVSLPAGGTGTADAALAQIISLGTVDTSGVILGVGVPANTIESPAVTMHVAKAGRTTGLTCSTIESVNTATQVQYSTSCKGGTNFNVNFNGQIVVSGASFSAGGDSGSLIVDANTAQPVGLLYAGDSASTVANPMANVLAALKDPSGTLSMVGRGFHSIACPAGSIAPLTVAPAQAEMARAAEVSRRRATEILSHPAVLGVGVGASMDSPGEAAILLYVDRSRLVERLPAVIGGVRTKIISQSPSKMEPDAAASGRISVIPEEMARASAVKEQVAARLMRDAAVFGVGVGVSEDSRGEAALVLFIDRSERYTPPAVFEGVRTKVVRSEPFRAYGWNERKRAQPSCLPRQNSSSARMNLLEPSWVRKLNDKVWLGAW